MTPAWWTRLSDAVSLGMGILMVTYLGPLLEVYISPEWLRTCVTGVITIVTIEALSEKVFGRLKLVVEWANEDKRGFRTDPVLKMHGDARTYSYQVRMRLTARSYMAKLVLAVLGRENVAVRIDFGEDGLVQVRVRDVEKLRQVQTKGGTILCALPKTGKDAYSTWVDVDCDLATDPPEGPAIERDVQIRLVGKHVNRGVPLLPVDCVVSKLSIKG